MIITKTPLRLSLLGGNTDFPKYFKKYGGACLTATIDKYIYVIVKKRFDREIWINYSIKEIVTDVNDIQHDLVRECLKLVGIREGIEITFLSDIPSEGSGLGSSSAVTVGLLNALHTYIGEHASAKLLAEEACKIEIDILHKPIGIQDQYAVAFGGVRFFTFNREITSKTIEGLSEKDFLLLYTGKTRKADNILSKMKLDKKILDINKQLAITSLSYINDPYALGGLLNNYWVLKRKLNKATTSNLIDKMYDTAGKAGALGGKIVGAGGGGFLLLVVSPEKRQKVKEALGLRELPFRFSKYGSKVIFDIEE